MRAVVQRVHRAKVASGGIVTGSINRGLLVFLGVESGDGDEDLRWLSQKLPTIRCFEDEEGKMNRSLIDIDGEMLVISQFTLFGNLRKGTRPSFNHAAPPDVAIPLYQRFVAESARLLGKPVPTGVFGQHMDIDVQNNGPVTLIIDSKRKDY